MNNSFEFKQVVNIDARKDIVNDLKSRKPNFIIVICEPIQRLSEYKQN
jgi:hypothetical protein